MGVGGAREFLAVRIVVLDTGMVQVKHDPRFSMLRFLQEWRQRQIRILTGISE